MRVATPTSAAFAALRSSDRWGPTPGVTIKLTGNWAVDLELIAFSRWDRNPPGTPDKSHTILGVDPGVVYNFGRFAGGLRLAVQVGQDVPLNFGFAF